MLSCLLILFCIFSINVFATIEPREVSSESNEVMPISEAGISQTNNYKDSDLFLYDVNVDLSDTVNGNVFIYAQTVNISGEIYGDVFVIADTINIAENALIHGNIFALSSSLSVSGIVSDIFTMSDSVTLNSTGIISRNIYATASNIDVSGKISRDANLSVNTLTLNENSSIEGNLNYSSENEAQITDNVVKGNVNFNQIKANTENQIISIIFSIIKTLILSFVIIMLLLWIAPKFKERVSEILAKKSLKSFGIGLLVFFGTIIGAFILLLFLYGFAANVAVLAVAILIIACVISPTVFSMAIGQLLANKFKLNGNTAYVLLSLLVMLIVKLIGYIPYIGLPVSIIIFILGLGIMCINSYKRTA